MLCCTKLTIVPLLQSVDVPAWIGSLPAGSVGIRVWSKEESDLLEEQSKTLIVFVVSLCCWLPPKLGETAKV